MIDGVKVAVVPLYVTTPLTPLLKVKVAGDTVVASIASLNVAVIAAFAATPVALYAGLIKETVGAVAAGFFSPPVVAPPPHAVNNKASKNTIP